MRVTFSSSNKHCVKLVKSEQAKSLLKGTQGDTASNGKATIGTDSTCNYASVHHLSDTGKSSETLGLAGLQGEAWSEYWET
jgi:hypothetical protein